MGHPPLARLRGDPVSIVGEPLSGTVESSGTFDAMDVAQLDMRPPSFPRRSRLSSLAWPDRRLPGRPSTMLTLLWLGCRLWARELRRDVPRP